jgi:UDP-N-acetylmuramoyl-tripeptide--D-alanyl-D-alanine ligase
MQPILVSTVKEIVKGTLVIGLEDRLILDAEHFVRRVKKPNMLTFVWENEQPDFNRIRKYSPCTVVTSQFFEEYRSIDSCTVILVNNVGEAYWTFVRYYRNSFKIPIITVTGTSGKTTTKDMMKHIISHYLKVTATVRTFNGNERVLPYLLRIDKSTEAAVFEIAVARRGDLSYACKYLRPDIGIITTIGAAHLNKCGSIENYIKAKAEIVSGLGENGILIINSDDEGTKKINLKDFKGRIVYFGIKNNAHFQASRVKYSSNGMEFILTFQNVKYPVFVQGYGEHQVYNALAALAAVHELGIGLKEAAEILASYEKLPKHFQVFNGINGSILIDDTWNLTSSSLISALKTFADIAQAQNKKKIALIGEIKYLGNTVGKIATEAGNLIADLGIDNVIITGQTAELVANGIKEKEGRTKINIFKDTTGIYDLLKELLDDNTIVMAKTHGGDPIGEILRSFQVK